MIGLTPHSGTSSPTLRDLPEDYTLDHLRGALSYLQRFRTAVDGGAHRGIWTRELARNFDQVIAFEPKETLALQIPCGFVHYVALGERKGRCSIREGVKNNGQGHVVAGDDVLMMPLDDFGIRDVDFLKLDLEGYELPALRGAVETIAQCQPAIMVEQNGLSARYGYTAVNLADWLKKRGYEIVNSWGVDVLYMPKNEHRRRL